MTAFCAACGVSFALTDIEFAIETDEGPVHRECYDGDAPMTQAEEEEENERRRDHGDPPLPPPHVGFNSNHGRTVLDDPLPGAETDCPECHAEPAINGSRGFECRGRSML